MIRGVPMAVFGVCFTVFVVLAAPGLTWLDGGELALAAGTMAVAHPPGEPAYLVLARLAALVPIGDLPFRLTLLAAATVAGAAACLAALVSSVAGGLRGVPGAQVPLAGAVAGLLFGLAPAASLQAVRPELYGLAALLGLLAVAGIRLGGRRGLALAVLPLCVAGAVHHAMLVAAIPGITLLAWGRGRGSLKAGLATTALMLGPGLLQFAWLPLRSWALTPLDFGTPRTLARTLWSVTGSGYARSFNPVAGQIQDNLVEHAVLVRGDLGDVGLALAAVGFAVLLRRAPRAAVAGALLVAVGVLPTALQGVFSPENPDARGYLLGVYASLAAASGIGAVALLDRLRPHVRGLLPVLGGALLLAACAQPLSGTWRLADRSELGSPARLGAALLGGAQPGAMLLLGGDSWTLPALYLRYWEGRRADVHVAMLHMLDAQAVGAMAERGLPVEPVPAGLLDGVVPGVVPEALLRHHARWLRAPLQVNEVLLPPELLDRRQPAGLLYRFDRPLDDEDRLWARSVEPLCGPAGLDPAARDILGRRYAARAGMLRWRGDGPGAQRALERGRRCPTDPWAHIHLLGYRVEQGLDGPGPRERLAAVAAIEQILAGEKAAAGEAVRSLLVRHPGHPWGLLAAERLHSLGVQAAPPVPGPDTDD